MTVREELIRLRDSAPSKQSYEAYQRMLDEYKKATNNIGGTQKQHN